MNAPDQTGPAARAERGDHTPALGERDEDADPEHREQRAAGELGRQVDGQLALEEAGRRPRDRGQRDVKPSALVLAAAAQLGAPAALDERPS